MYNLQDALTSISIDDIMSKVSEYELWKYYCPNFETIDKSFKSELYKDNNPACRIYYNNGKLLYKDFGTQQSYSVLEYIKTKYNCTYKECLNIINNDFKITKSNIITSKDFKLQYLNDEPIIRHKSTIDIIQQGYTASDYEYWKQYHIPLELLEEEEIISCKSVYLSTYKGVYRYEYKKHSPIFAFKEYNLDLEFLGYKIYFPLAQKGSKWLNNSSDKAIQGIKSIDYNKDLIGLTKSRKDILCYKLLGIQTIAPYNETSNLDINGISTVLDKFPKKFLSYDNDLTGIQATLQINMKYGYPYFYIDKNEKDLSDFIKSQGLKKAKQMINNKLKQINE